MKPSIAIIGLSVFTFVGCKTDSQPIAANQPAQSTSQQAQTTQVLAPAPKFGWRTFHEEAFETTPGDAKRFSVPPAANKLRVVVQADSAIFGGVFHQAFLSTKGRKLLARDFQQSPCSLWLVVKGGSTCTIDSHEPVAFLVRDKRAEGAVLMAAVGVRLRSSKIVERETLPNKIHISLATWQCIEHCGTS